MTPLVVDRFMEVQARQLGRGNHTSLDEGLCVMEAVAYVAGEEWSDTPACACPVVAAFLRTWNDALPDDETRTRLLSPLVPRLVDSRSTREVEQRRAELAVDWLVRTCAPAWLDLMPALASHASALRALPVLVADEAIAQARPLLSAAAADASAAWDAARDAAWDAARDAAWDAGLDKAASCPDGTYGAVYQACVALFAPTRATLERSALELIDRMLAVTPESLDPDAGAGVQA